MAAARRDWMHTFPPLRFKPRLGRRRHHSVHHTYHHPVEGMFLGIGTMFVGIALMYAWMLALTIWLIEAEIWCGAWGYYGLFLGARWIYRRNILGQTTQTLTGRRKPQQAAYDPHGAPRQPIDLAAMQQPPTDPWDTASSRSRG